MDIVVQISIVKPHGEALRVAYLKLGRFQEYRSDATIVEAPIREFYDYEGSALNWYSTLNAFVVAYRTYLALNVLTLE